MKNDSSEISFYILASDENTFWLKWKNTSSKLARQKVEICLNKKTTPRTNPFLSLRKSKQRVLSNPGQTSIVWTALLRQYFFLILSRTRYLKYKVKLKLFCVWYRIIESKILSSSQLGEFSFSAHSLIERNLLFSI